MYSFNLKYCVFYNIFLFFLIIHNSLVFLICKYRPEQPSSSDDEDIPVLTKMAQERPEWIMQFRKESGFDAKSNQLFNCECCRQESRPAFSDNHLKIIRHLYTQHHQKSSEIIANPEYEAVAKKFYLRPKQYVEVGKCRELNCDDDVKSMFGKALPFKNHSITHHEEDKKSFFAKAVESVSGQKILNNYEIKDTEIANCSFCRTPFPLKNLDSHPAEVLSILSNHWNEHIRYK